jgi:polyvinyl alcohol dehydrogenase (cytochrome)
MRARAFLISVFAVLPLTADDWPMYLKDLAHSSFVSSETHLSASQITNLQRIWDLSVGAPVASGVTVSNGVLYFGDWNGYFHAVNAHTGSQLWQTFVGKAADPPDPTCMPAVGVTSQPTVLGSAVYVGGGDSAVYALATSSGNRIWRVALADPASGSYLWSSIVPYRNMLYTGIASLGDCPLVRGAMVRIDPSDPQQPLVSYLTSQGTLGAGVWSSPAVDSATNTIFVTTGNGDPPQDPRIGNYSEAALALDATTLQVKSNFFLPAEELMFDLDWGSSATLFTTPDGDPMMAATGKDGNLYALRRADLSLAWQTQVAVGCGNPVEGCGSISTPAFDGKTLFLGAGVRDPNLAFGGSVYAINPANGSVIWRQDTNGTVIAPVTIANGLVFVATTSGFEIYHAGTGQFLWSDPNGGTMFGQPVVVDGVVYTTYVSGDVVAWAIPAAGAQTTYSFSGASFLPSVAPGAIASIFGSALQGATVTVEDGAGASEPATVLFTSPGQVNFLLPDDAAIGPGAVMVTTANGTTLSSAVQISAVAPGIFTANGNGTGIAAAEVFTVGSDGSQNYVPVAQCGSAPGSCAAQPVSLETGPAVLILYGTGIRGLSALANVSATIGGISSTVLYAGPQNDYQGLDQVNVEIPAELAGQGEVQVILSVDGQLSNTVTVSFQ